MTPQLIQSIKLLQLTHVELAQFVEQEVERNPLLERVEDGEGGADTAFNDDAPHEDKAGPEDRDKPAADAQDWTGDPPLDVSYDNVYPDDGDVSRAGSPDMLDNWKSMPGANGAASSDGFDLDEFAAAHATLRDHACEQIALLIVDVVDRRIAAEIAESLDDAGYVRFDAGEVAARLGTDAAHVEAVLAKLHDAEPAGLFARSLEECLALQLRARDRFDPAMRKLVGCLDLLARRDFASLRSICGVDEEDLLEMMREIRALDPKPGLRFQSGPTETVVPDVVVQPDSKGGWKVEMTPQALPRVLVNRDYHAHVSKAVARVPEEQTFLAECLQNANWLTRSLDQRARTIVKVASEIVRRQDAFLLHGIAHLRPLNLRAVADAIGMHESTVSRVTANKYMMTPRGVFEMKFFFTVSIGSSAGGEAHSAEAVRQSIRRLVDEETPDAVLSDDEIVKRLAATGVEIARRTVAKYREAMHIPSSVQRRREKRALAKAGRSQATARTERPGYPAGH